MAAQVFILILSFVIGFSLNANAQEESPKVGRKEAAKYFEKRQPSSIDADAHYLAIHGGKYLDASAWEWGQKERENNAATFNLGLTYKIEQFNETMDWDLRVDFSEYDIVGERPFKMSFVPMIIFPDAASKFPLYFGAGAGAGVFFKQVKDESYLSFDYQLIMGARFFDVYNNMGFFIETGLKNHLLLLSSGQLNGTVLSIGTVFSF